MGIIEDLFYIIVLAVIFYYLGFFNGESIPFY